MNNIATPDEIKSAIIYFLLKIKFTGDYGTIMFAKYFDLLFVSGDALAVVASIANEVDTVGGYLQLSRTNAAPFRKGICDNGNDTSIDGSPDDTNDDSNDVSFILTHSQIITQKNGKHL
jgi:hypothetical protein